MMVLRHVGPPSTTVTGHEEIPIPGDHDDRTTTIPIDLSNKHLNNSSSSSSSPSPELPRHLNRNPFISVIPSPRSISSPRTPPSHTYLLNNNNNSNVVNNNNINFSSSGGLVSKCSSPQSSNSDENSPRSGGGGGLIKSDVWRHRKKDLRDMRWRDVNLLSAQTQNRGNNNNDDELNNSHSSPDSGLHRDSPGEDEDVTSSKATTPPHHLSSSATAVGVRKQPQTLIPLSIIRARYPHSAIGDSPEEDSSSVSPKMGRAQGDQVLTKRARLEEMVTNIKSSKDRSRRNSGEDDTSSGDHAISSDEGPADLRSSALHVALSKTKAGGLKIKSNKDLNDDDDIMDEDDEPCNLVCPQNRIRSSNSSRAEDLQFDGWKNNNNNNNSAKSLKPPPPMDTSSLSPSEAAKMLGVDPDTYQQQMMQLQLTSAAMMGSDPSALLKGPYPPWVLMGYYSQLLQSFQAQEILRQYAMQANPLTPPNNVSQGDKSPSINIARNVMPSRYNCQSPLSPASMSEGPAGVDSDGSTVGQSTPGSGNNGKRAPRAMTGRHVRTGTGASPSTLQTLRQKIEERQRIKAQQAKSDLLNQPNSKIKSNKYLKKSTSTTKK